MLQNRLFCGGLDSSGRFHVIRSDFYCSEVGVASKDPAAKQWQKLIQLGLEHLFHAATVSEETGQEQFTTGALSRTLDKLAVKPEEAVFVGCDLAHEIAVANAAKMITVRIRTGADRTGSPRDAGEKPAYEIGKISEVFQILQGS
jgi:FMN phosphatase YigB (HAD superfamily)